MKITVLMVLLFSTTSMACPNLAGKYTCVNPAIPNLSTSIEVSQSSHGGTISYQVAMPNETLTYIADGNPYTKVVTDEQITTTSSCVQGRLFVSMNATNASTNRKATIDWSPTETGFHTFTHVFQTGSYEYVQDNELNCFR